MHVPLQCLGQLASAAWMLGLTLGCLEGSELVVFSPSGLGLRGGQVILMQSVPGPQWSTVHMAILAWIQWQTALYKMRDPADETSIS